MCPAIQMVKVGADTDCLCSAALLHAVRWCAAMQVASRLWCLWGIVVPCAHVVIPGDWGG